MSIPKSISVKDTAKKLKVSDQHVRTLLRNGVLKGKQFGRQWLVAEKAVEYYAKGSKEKSEIDRSRKAGALPKIKALSFFSGAMGLDLGLEHAGIHVLLACEMDKACRKTIATNRPDVALLGDVWKYSAEEIRNAAGLKPKDEIDVIVGGPPCQAFSTAGSRRSFEDTRGNVFLKYIELILELQPKYAVVENVRGLLSAPMSHRPHSERGAGKPKLSDNELPGGALHHVLQMLRKGGYEVSFNLYNSANFGVPQVRERVILICHRGEQKVPHLVPTHSQDGSGDLPKWRTLKEAFKGMSNVKHQHVKFPEERLRFYRMLEPGQYWKHLPKKLQQEALGNSFHSGGGKTGFLRRLDWNKPSCTLVTTPNMPATDICHPTQDRPISIQEYKRIQQFPDDWEVCGSLSDQYRQIGNAVPVGLGAAVGRAIIAHMNGIEAVPPENFVFSRYRDTDEASWEAKAIQTLMMRPKLNVHAKSIKRKSDDKRDPAQTILFPFESAA